jgi:hypothetical protein
MTRRPRDVVYRGPVAGAVALLEMLGAHGVEVAYDPPLQSRSRIGQPHGVTIYYLCTAPDKAITAAKIQFNNSRHAESGSVTVEPSSEEAPNGNDLMPGHTST